jgi:hypothetical protein
MTASVISSSYVTNPKANPQVKDPLGSDARAKARHILGTMEVATTSLDEANDVIILFQVKGNQRMCSLKFYNDDLDSNGSPALSMKVGLYKDVNAAGTAATAVDDDCYATALTAMQAAVTAGTELITNTRNIDKIGQTVAADGGESEHSDVRYVGIKIGTAAGTAAAGTVSWDCEVVEA